MTDAPALPALAAAVRSGRARALAALAARFRDLDLAEDAWAEACAVAAEAWPRTGAPRDALAWLYAVAARRALDALRRRRTRERHVAALADSTELDDDAMDDGSPLIPDERLRLIFVCCHPALAAEARVALTLRLICGLSTAAIAQAFLLNEASLAQRIVRAKRKIADAGVPYEVPGPALWPERLGAVLSTVEIAYAKAHEDAAGAGEHAGFATEVIGLTGTLRDLLPGVADVHALAATVRFAEARRPARLDEHGAMTPLSEQDPALWRRPLIAEGERALRAALALDPTSPRVVQAAIHATWCARPDLAHPPPWPAVLGLYDRLLERRDDAIVRLNRAVALAEVAGPEKALAEVEALGAEMERLPSFHAVRADLLRRLGRVEDARDAYRRTLAFDPGPAERMWLERRLAGLC